MRRAVQRIRLKMAGEDYMPLAKLSAQVANAQIPSCYVPGAWVQGCETHILRCLAERPEGSDEEFFRVCHVHRAKRE
jgi:hypothetical protein